MESNIIPLPFASVRGLAVRVPDDLVREFRSVAHEAYLQAQKPKVTIYLQIKKKV